MTGRRLVLLVLVVGIGLLGSVFYGSPFVQSGTDSGPPTNEAMFQPGEAEHYLWPYTSRHRSVNGRTLAINVVIHGEPDDVERALTRTLNGNWSAVEGDDGFPDGGPNASRDDALAPAWESARGAARYTYISTEPNQTGEWITADYQLATGTYFGERTHIRAYTADAIGWTALQVHNEYWDWFRLRHTVTGVAPGARVVEQNFRNEPGVVSISRIYHGLEGGGSDGWLTVIELTTAALIFGFVVPFGSRRVESRALILLPLTLTAIIFGVRAAGIALETLLPAANPHLIAGGLYPVVVVGPPIAVAWFARNGPAPRMIIGTIVGLGAGFALDFGFLGVSMLPLDLVFHRLALIAALGILTLGVARTDRRTILVGVVAWLLGLATALLGVF